MDKSRESDGKIRTFSYRSSESDGKMDESWESDVKIGLFPINHGTWESDGKMALRHGV